MLSLSNNLNEIRIFMTDCSFQSAIRFIKNRTAFKEVRMVSIQTMNSMGFDKVYEEIKDLMVKNLSIVIFELKFSKEFLTNEVIWKLENGHEL